MHYKDTSAWGAVYLYAWRAGPVELLGAWPGKAIQSEGSSWFAYTLTNVSNCNLIFNNGASLKTADLGRTNLDGWYKSGTWYDAFPDETTPPVVAVTAPANGATLAGSVSFTANASDNVGVSKVEFWYDSTKIGEDASSPFAVTWDTTLVPNSIHTAFAIAIDLAGNRATNSVSVTTANANTPPVADAGCTKYVLKDTDFQLDGSASFDPNGTIQSWSWSFPGSAQNASRSGSKVSNRYSSLGSNSVTLTVTDDLGATGTTNVLVIVTTNPPATRYDPRQESIYFILTARWFDGDTANSVGDEWCSATPARLANAGNGFTGADDVTWRGDFKGLVEKMDYIKALGFTCIWITPVVQNRSPLAYHGYHGWDFTKEDARLVSPGYDFQRVVDEAHNRGMKICLDIVINHSGRFGIKDFSEIKYNTDPALYPQPDSPTPGWEYDGLHSPGATNGVPLPPGQPVNVRPYDANDLAHFPYLANDKNAQGFMKYEWPCSESYCKTIDGVWSNGGAPGSLTYDQYKASARRHRGHNTGFPTGSGSFDNFPDTHFDSCHEDCPDLNTENSDVQNYLLNAYYRYIDMGVDIFRVDTVMHIHKQTVNDMYWGQLMDHANQPLAKGKRGGGDFFMFGEVGNFVMQVTDKPTMLRQQNYTWDNAHNDVSGSLNHKLNGNNYRTPDYSAKAPYGAAPYHFSVIDMIGFNQFCNSPGAGYGHCIDHDDIYNDATYLVWYADAHDYGPNKSTTRYKGPFEEVWSMLFTFRGIPCVYYGSEIRFKQDMPNDWPGGVDKSLELTGRGYYGGALAGSVSASGFGDYTASGQVATTLDSILSRHLRFLNKIRLAVPALQMGQYETAGCSGGWASFKRRFTGTVGGAAIDSYAVVGVGGGSHSYSGLLDGTYKDCVTGDVKTVSGGNLSFTVPSDGPNANANLRVYVLNDLSTKAPGDVVDSTASDYIH